VARKNVKAKEVFDATTHGGASTKSVSNEDQLRRAVLSCLLWEDQFYEDGQKIADRIVQLASTCSPEFVVDLAIEARSKFHLRHVPLLLLTVVAKTGAGKPGLVANAVETVISRADELGELLAIYWRDGRRPISAQLKKGLARALRKFDEYALAKYNRDTVVKLRDVLFLTHAKPKDDEQAALWRRLVDGKLVTPDTWEVALSKGGDKKDEFSRLLAEGKLGYLALLRNLRNMVDSKVERKLVRDAIRARKNGADRVLPFRYVAAAKHAPSFADDISDAFLQSFEGQPKLPGKTVVVIDVSGSMYGGVMSKKSDMNRADAACALGAIMREVCEDPIIYATAGNDAVRKHKTVPVANYRGLPLVKSIYDMCHPLGGGGIFLKQVMDFIHADVGEDIDRVVVITDEADCGIGVEDSPLRARALGKRNYVINVASYEHSITNGAWTKINGFSESVVRYIIENETPRN